MVGNEQMNKCNYFMAYVGYCEKEKINDIGCITHQLYCTCKKPAKGECSAATSLVCGAPTCKDTKHGYCHYHEGE